ncbi:hypothetical protein EZ449_20055 [Pedobacter frigidisoli]|uniref:SnoaL-like domain-containing protein n=1 Tax=Pedobacter frigidisoli TaxID=2530455 RepID=A0A4R0NJ27_9SPHI|nr:hypothetical protein [Pedobacter frigidisoli]TCD00661.1 hypothetical protein EZ449_20055 [Pedobacter frigidisoli]
MKKISSLFVIALFFAACQNKEAKTTDSATADTTKYPYTPKKNRNWEMNADSKNMVVAMSALKAFANLDTTSLKPLLGDSLQLNVDGYEFKGTSSQFLKEAKHEMDKFKSIKIMLEDMESVISKDKTEEYVSLWYTQASEMKDGKTDTVNFFNDFKLKNGKVVHWSEYVQHPMKK